MYCVASFAGFKHGAMIIRKGNVSSVTNWTETDRWSLGLGLLMRWGCGFIFYIIINKLSIIIRSKCVSVKTILK